jgi:UDP-N-acetylmuramate: L-alanyl-gamma-D-glutamyl-meso-diaminopimelate ligase
MNLQHFWDADRLKKEKSSIKKIFFYRICGTGMGACACLFRENGFDVEGGDHLYYPPMSDFLEQSEITLHTLEDLGPEDYQKYDLIIVGNVVSGKSEQARFIEELGVPFTSFPSAMGSLLLEPKNVVGICGTHGKTTTTYFMKQILEKATGKVPGFFIGGVLDEGVPASMGESDVFVIEADEYDSSYFQKISKFRLYELKNMILTSLEFDHADIFETIDDIKDEFKGSLKKGGRTIVVNEQYPAGLSLFSDYKEKFKSSQTYGLRSPKIIEADSEGTRFSLNYQNEERPFETNICGIHNIENISAILLWCLSEGIEKSKLQNAVKSLNMVKRRQEERGKYKGALVIDDFAHHPKAIEVTLQGLKQKYKNQKIFVVLDPSSATGRSDLFQNEYPKSLSLADGLILAKPQKKTIALGRGDLNAEQVVKDWKSLATGPSRCVKTVEELIQAINSLELDGQVLAVLSNSTCLGLWERSFAQDLY